METPTHLLWSFLAPEASLAQIQKYKNGIKLQDRKLAWTLWWFPCPLTPPALEFCLDLASRHIPSAFSRQRCLTLAMCIWFKKRKRRTALNKPLHSKGQISFPCSKCDRETQIYSRSHSPQVQPCSTANFMCRLAGSFLWVSRWPGMLYVQEDRGLYGGQPGFGEKSDDM